MDRASQIVAANLRFYRARARLSLAGLARASGVAKATLSNLEGGVGNPTIQTLWSISNALGTSFSDLLVERSNDAEMQVVRAADLTAPPGHGEEVIDLFCRWPARGVTEVYLMTLGPDSRYDSEPHAKGTVEHLIVAEGAVRCGPVDKPVELEQHDYVRFPGDVDHVYQPVGGQARCFLIMSYATA